MPLNSLCACRVGTGRAVPSMYAVISMSNSKGDVAVADIHLDGYYYCFSEVLCIYIATGVTNFCTWEGPVFDPNINALPTW
jgi:hypothetical protein